MLSNKLINSIDNHLMTCACPHHRTALHYAAEYGHIDSVKLLLKLGANSNILDSRSYTTLDVAKTNDIKNILISNGAMNGDKMPKILLSVPRKGNCKYIE